jgi:hypothetical protein
MTQLCIVSIIEYIFSHQISLPIIWDATKRGFMFSFKDPADFDRTRDVLEEAGYTDNGVIQALGINEFSAIGGSDLPVLLRRTKRGTPLDTLIRLFLLEVPVDVQALRKAIQPLQLETWVHAGIAEVDGGSVVATLKLLPYRNLLLAFDLPRRLQTAFGHDYVMGVGRSSLTLANLTVRRQARLTLDLGAGCGIQALLAAGHSDRIMAVDRNSRAVMISAFNAKLSGITNIECLEGDFFEPVLGQTFDLIISNPPFVISPEMRYLYRDSGMHGDQVSRKIAQEAPQFLSEGGYCQVLCNWADYTGEDWRVRLATWFDRAGCDVWVLRSETRDAETYASTWIRHTEKAEPDDFPRRFEKWMAYYEQHNIAAVSAGLITMRRRVADKNWFRADDGPEKMLGPCGEDILLAFELRDFLETVRDDSKLLDTRLRVSPDIRLEQQSVPSDKGWLEVVSRVRLTKGLAYMGNIDSHVADLFMRCDGRRQLRDNLADMANSLGVDLEKIGPTFCELVRGLIERGFLLP